MRELVYLYRTENYDYAKELLEQQCGAGVFRMLAAKYRHAISFMQLTQTDLQTICAKALDQALLLYDYKSKPASSFKSFYCLMAIRQMQALMHQQSSASHVHFATKVVSLDSEILSKAQLSALTYEPPVIADYQTNDLDFVVRVGLTEGERSVLDLKLSGYKNREIAVLMASNAKSVANTYEKAKRRLKDYLYENGECKVKG